MKKLSIIIPSYRETKTQVLETLLSIDIQKRINFSDIEVIVVNDSGDFLYENNTETDFDCLQNFTVKYIHNTPNGGPLKARQCGFNNSTGQFVQFIDAEDSIINILYLQAVLTIIDGNEYDIILSEITREDCINNLFFYKNEDPFFCSFHGKVIRREFINKNIVWLDERATYAEDEYFMRQIFDSTPRYYIINIPTYYYKFNKNSLVHSFGATIDDYYPIKFPEYLTRMSQYLEVTKNKRNDILNMRATELLIKMILHLDSANFKYAPNYIQTINASRKFYLTWGQYIINNEDYIRAFSKGMGREIDLETFNSLLKILQ